MSHEVSLPSDTEAEVIVRLKADEVKEQVEQELRGLAKRAQMPGFRPGKVPRQMLLKKYGKAVELDARQKLIEREFQAAVKHNDLRPVSPPSVNPEEMETTPSGELMLKIPVEVIQNFAVEGYRDIRVAVPDSSITDEDVQREVDKMLKGHGQLEEVEGAAADGDLIIVDVVYNLMDGTALPVQEGQWIDTDQGIVQGMPCPAAIGKFTGLQVGAEEKLAVDLNDQFAIEEHRGKTSIAHCTIKSIRRMNKPSLEDPEYLEKLGVESAIEAENRVRDRMQHELDHRRNQAIEEQCLERLIETHPFEIPPGYFEREKDSERQRTRKDLTDRGAPAEDIERHLLEIEGQIGERTDHRIRVETLLDKIAEAENVEVGEEDLQRHFGMMSQLLQIPAQQLFDEMYENGTLRDVVGSLRRDKARRVLREAAVTTDDVDSEGSSASASEDDDAPNSKSTAQESP